MVKTERSGGRNIYGSRVNLRKKKLSDARTDYTWQTDAELVELDAAPVLAMSFPQYLIEYVSHLRNPSPTRRLFAIDTFDGKHIGNCTYYNIDEVCGEAEVGIVIGDREYWDKGYGTDSVNVLVDHVFLQTDFRRVYLKTLDWNLRAQKCFQKCGFTPCGQINQDGYNFVLMEMLRETWGQRKRPPQP